MVFRASFLYIRFSFCHSLAFTTGLFEVGSGQPQRGQLDTMFGARIKTANMVTGCDGLGSWCSH